MTILATMPGKFGDILWSLPTVRLLAARHDTKVDFMTSPAHASILRLIQRQPYIRETWTGKDWDVTSEDTAQNRVPPVCDCDCHGYEEIYHLGYREWPSQRLAEEIRESVGLARNPSDSALALHEPWITVPDAARETEGTVIAVGFSEEHIELKMGILLGLASKFSEVAWQLLLPPRMPHRAWEWVEVAGYPVEYCETNWEEAAAAIASADLFFGCLSSLWVLANAVGTPTVIMEPMVARHNPIFWRESPKNHLVIGNDGKPTFDLRHTAEMITAVLEEVDCTCTAYGGKGTHAPTCKEVENG